MPKRHVILALVALAAVIFAVRGPERATAPNGSIAKAADVVERVVDGDTLVLRSAGKSRLIGVDTPEVFGRPGCFGEQASAFAKRTLRPGLRVMVGHGSEPRDRYGRRLIYLWLRDGRSFNELLVREGFAVALAIAPNTRFADRFRELADQARVAQAGLWSPATCAGQVRGPR